MASRGQSVTITYVAWDTSSNVGKTGDVANHTLRLVRDGTSAAPTNSASEVDATNAPGVYKLTITTSEAACNVAVLAGKSSTANVSIIPTTITFEQLPTAAPEAAGGLITYGTGTGQFNPSSGNVTVGALGSAVITASSIASGAITAAKFATDAIDSTVLATNAVTEIANGVWSTSVPASFTAGQAGYVLGNVATGTPPTAAAIADAVWDEAGSGHTTSGTFGKYVADILDDTGTSGVVLTSAGLDGITIETGVNARQAMSAILAASAGVVSGAGTTTVTIKGGNVATNRISATVDSDGNRSAVTLSLPT